MSENLATGALPATGFVRESQLVNQRALEARAAVDDKPARRARSAVRGIIPFSGPTLWRMVKAGTFPAPVKLGERMTAWRAEDVRAWMESRTNGGAQ